MKRTKLVLVGDSIRKGYESAVHDLLGEEWEVISPYENCKTALDILNNVHRWILQYEPDVIHLNAGLYDIRRDPEAYLPKLPPWAYARALSELFRTLTDNTYARIIWATITPVDEVLQREESMTLRTETDVVLYNRIATRIALEWGVELNDLYSRSILLGPDGMLTKDGVHFSPQGYLFLAQNVVEVVERGQLGNASHEQLI